MKISRTAIKTICLMLTFTAVLMLSGCTSYDNFRRTFIDKETEDSNVIYVGVFEPESGQYKKVGKEEIKGIQLAHSMYSNVKGVRVELVRIDTESDTNTAKAAIQSLIKLNPVAIIGSAEEARKAKIPMITPSASNPLITENNPYAFRACITYDQRGTGLAEYTIKELSAKKVAIITIQNDSTQEKMRSAFKARLRKEGKKSGPEVVLDESIGINEFNMVKLAKQIQKSGAEVVFSPIGLEKADLLYQQIEKRNMTNIRFLGNQEWLTEDFLKMKEKHPQIKISFTSDNVLNSGGTAETGFTAETQRFLVKYANRYGQRDIPTQNTVLGYDAYMLTINAINNARSLKPTDIRDALADTKDLRCATGVFNFDRDGNPVRRVNISTVRDGKLVSAYVTKSKTKADSMKKIEH